MSTANELTANWLGALTVGLGDLLDHSLRKESGLDPAAVAAVLTVRARPGQSVSDLAGALALTHSGCVRVVGRLVDSGLLVRGPGPDGRTRGLRLTEAGEDAGRRMLRARRQALEGVVGRLSSEEAGSLERALRALLPHLPGDRASARRICRLCEHDVCRGDDCVVSVAADD
ncbi:MarR family winged helix-turn-helix transcriptional regulator [Streptomyces sp. WMMB 322]|uniref:MarR family winged helix-turn-helix transcriptional regulator n=1 Tax=Streptomyces sp. WMMB 322 TaxID=1286821 RepID=UPI0006E2F9D1|nr:MarR family winged helix-turn-helix transcriptional regulator [Streptomyces sp. WMMB 322]SCK29194.1 DNA-binding transcriptional regulator, MarR family [Streptomyces sp. WMMB 322]